MGFFRRPFVYAGLFTLCLLAFTTYVLLDTYCLAHPLADVIEPPASSATAATTQTTGTQVTGQIKTFSSESSTAKTTVVQTDDTYNDGQIAITLRTLRVYDTTVYLADVQIASADYLKTALARDTYGTNITEKTSAIAANKQAILAVNGDYYGANSRGYVIKNGVLYRDSVRRDSAYGDLAVYAGGSFAIIQEEEQSAQELLDSGVRQLFAFGPALVEDSHICVSEGTEVGKAMSSNPRTAIGMVAPLHYIFAVSDGRTEESEGLTLVQLAQVMQEAGCTLAYNLDGGGSSTLYFNGQVVNNPTTNGRTISERAVSDIVYIGI